MSRRHNIEPHHRRPQTPKRISKKQTNRPVLGVSIYSSTSRELRKTKEALHSHTSYDLRCSESLVNSHLFQLELARLQQAPGILFRATRVARSTHKTSQHVTNYALKLPPQRAGLQDLVTPVTVKCGNIWGPTGAPPNPEWPRLIRCKLHIPPTELTPPISFTCVSSKQTTEAIAAAMSSTHMGRNVRR